MNKEVRTIIVDGTAIRTCQTAVEIVDKLRRCDDIKDEMNRLNNLIGKTTNYYFKTVAKNGSMPEESVEMFILLDWNK